MISGAAGGIGAAIARRYCEEGASVALLDLDPKALEEQGKHLRLKDTMLLGIPQT
ncbi:SDR family NAD(P)-dependent oxidoreductase [Pseudomonas juntendi]|nr:MULTISPECIES: SDR family NAD(P)-dependent oxidoreductase [Pseudomonas]MCL8328472.1 SDR family NAD(P)-dependent oxidoreductase [Pseudomonas juntendi]